MGTTVDEQRIDAVEDLQAVITDVFHELVPVYKRMQQRRKRFTDEWDDCEILNAQISRLVKLHRMIDGYNTKYGRKDQGQ